MENINEITLNEILDWLNESDLSVFQTGDLVALAEILGKHKDRNKVIELILEKVLIELRKRSVKRKIWIPGGPGKKGKYKEEDY